MTVKTCYSAKEMDELLKRAIRNDNSAIFCRLMSALSSNSNVYGPDSDVTKKSFSKMAEYLLRIPMKAGNYDLLDKLQGKELELASKNLSKCLNSGKDTVFDALIETHMTNCDLYGADCDISNKSLKELQGYLLMMSSEDPLMTLKELGKFLRVNPLELSSKVFAGLLPHKCIGGEIMVRKSDAQELYWKAKTA